MPGKTPPAKLKRRKDLLQKSVGHVIRRLRVEEAKISSYEKFSELVNLSANQMGNIERGQSFPEIENLLLISDATGKKISEIFKDAGY